jgi:hypothetical protein
VGIVKDMATFQVFAEGRKKYGTEESVNGKRLNCGGDHSPDLLEWLAYCLQRLLHFNYIVIVKGYTLLGLNVLFCFNVTPESL